MKKLILVIIALLLPIQAIARIKVNIPAEIALEILKKGNNRFIEYKMEHPHIDVKRREQIINGQRPFAIILTDSDSRIPPEIIFDQGLGDLFVIRNAGNVINEATIGSIEYGVYHLGINLIIVLENQYSAIVGEALKNKVETPGLESLKSAMQPAIDKCKEEEKEQENGKPGEYCSYEKVIQTHAKLNVKELWENKGLSTYAKRHDLMIIPAFYNVDNGLVTILEIDDED